MGDWFETTIGEQATLQRGFDITRSTQRAGSVPVVSSSGVSSFHDTAAVEGPGVVLGRKGVVGSVFYIETDFWPHDTSLWVKDFHSNDRRFVYYFFKSLAPRLANLDVGSANPTLNRNHVHPIPVLWPKSVVEQVAISEVLGAFDDKIELNRRMNETLEAMAQAIFRDWFVDFGPVRRKLAGATDPVEVMGGVTTDAARAAELAALFPDRLDDDIPSGWTVEPVLNQANWVNGAAYKKMHFVERSEGLPVIKIAELKAGITSTTGFTNTDLGARYRIDDGELLFSWSGNPDTSIDTFIWTGGRAWLNQHIFAVRSNGSRSRPFLFTMLKYLNPTFAELARDKQTTGLGHVTKEDLKRLQVVIPPSAVETAFEALALPMVSRLQAALLENRTLASTRDYLLPRLMSGQIRVGDATREIAA